MCRNLQSRGVSQSSLWRALFLLSFFFVGGLLWGLPESCVLFGKLLFHPQCISCRFPGLLVPPPPYPSAMEALGSSFGVDGRLRLSVLCRPVAVRRGCLLIAALTGDAFQFTRHHPMSHCIWCSEQLREVEWIRLHK